MSWPAAAVSSMPGRCARPPAVCWWLMSWRMNSSQRLHKRAQAIRVADPFDPDVEMGALVNQAQYQRVLGHIDRGLSAGARVALRRQSSGGSAARLFLAADGVHRRAAGQCVVVRRDFRPGAVCAQFQQRSRGDCAGQRQPVRPGGQCGDGVMPRPPSVWPMPCRRGWCGSMRRK